MSKQLSPAWGRLLVSCTLLLFVLLSVAAVPARGNWPSQVVRDGNRVGHYTSLEIPATGEPTICFYDYADGDLEYAWMAAGQWYTETVDSQGDVGAYSSMIALAGSQIMIGYLDLTTTSLKCAWLDQETWRTEVVDSDAASGYVCVRELPSGQPAISYWDRTNTNLKYAVLTGSDESNPGHWKTEVVDSVKDVGEWTSLAVWNGEPAISYYDSTNLHLKFTWHAGGVWNTTTVDSGAKTGEYTSLRIVQGAPAISYRSNGDLKCARLVGANPGVATDWQCDIVDDEGDLSYSSLCDIGGRAAVAYWDDDRCDLKFAVAP